MARWLGLVGILGAAGCMIQAHSAAHTAAETELETTLEHEMEVEQRAVEADLTQLLETERAILQRLDAMILRRCDP
jgi:hypothetical protein